MGGNLRIAITDSFHLTADVEYALTDEDSDETNLSGFAGIEFTW